MVKKYDCFGDEFLKEEPETNIKENNQANEPSATATWIGTFDKKVLTTEHFEDDLYVWRLLLYNKD